MKIQVLSDLHIEFINFDMVKSDADIIVLAGDIHVGERGVAWAIENITEHPVIYIVGNHEYYGKAYPKLLQKLKKLAFGTQVHILENDSILIQDTIFLGCTLWTDFELFSDFRKASNQAYISMTDFKKIRVSPKYSKFKVSDAAVIHKKSLNWLRNELISHKHRDLVVVTHHAPSARSIPEKYKDDILSAAYASHLDSIVEQSEAKLWIHGHVHEHFDYMIGSTRVVCNPRGYPDEMNHLFDPCFVVEV